MRLVVVAALVLAGCSAPVSAPEPEPLPEPDIAAWAWTERAAAPMILAETAVASEGPNIYVVGGWTDAGGGSPFVLRYDAMNDTWSELPPYPMPIHHAQAAALDGTLYVFGGAMTTVPLPGSLVGIGPPGWPRTPLSFKLSPGAPAWEPIAPMPDARGLGGAAVLDGEIYLVGGIGLDGYLAAVHVYDPASDSYHEAAPLPTPRDHLSVVSHAGKLYALAGRSNAGGSWDDLETAEVLDPASGEWSSLPPAPLGRGGQGAGVVGDGMLALVGGENAEGAFAVYDAAHALAISNATWLDLPPLPQPLHGMAAASWDGKLFVMGGATEAGGIETSAWMLAAAGGPSADMDPGPTRKA